MCVLTSQLVWEPTIVHYETYTSVMWKLEASTALYTGNGLFSEVGDILCQVVKMNRICIFIDSVFLSTKQKKATIKNFFVEKSYQTQITIPSRLFACRKTCLDGIFKYKS